MTDKDLKIEKKISVSGDLSTEELDEIELQAGLEVEEELKAEAKEVALKAAKAKIKASAKEANKVAGKGTRMVMINLGKHSDRITIDGRTFIQGRSYALTPEQEESIKDMAFRTHLHQAELRGKNFLRDFYGARPAGQTI